MAFKQIIGSSFLVAACLVTMGGVANAGEKQSKPVIKKDFSIHYRADGEARVYYSYRDKQLPDIFIKPENHGEINLTSTEEVWDIEPSYSSDSKKIVYSSGPSMKRLDLWVMNADGSHKALLHKDERSAVGAKWSPDNTKIAFSSIVFSKILGKNRTSNIYVVNADGTGLKNLTEDIPGTATSPSWSQDGKTLLFSHGKTIKGQQDIYRMAANGHHKVQLTHTELSEAGPIFTPDETMIVYTAQKGEHSQLFVIAAQGQKEGDIGVSLTQSFQADSYTASFSPNRAHLIFSVGDWTNGFEMAHVPTPHIGALKHHTGVKE